jgi:hypothetical protein
MTPPIYPMLLAATARGATKRAAITPTLNVRFLLSYGPAVRPAYCSLPPFLAVWVSRAVTPT